MIGEIASDWGGPPVPSAERYAGIRVGRAIATSRRDARAKRVVPSSLHAGDEDGGGPQSPIQGSSAADHLRAGPEAEGRAFVCKETIVCRGQGGVGQQHSSGASCHGRTASTGGESPRNDGRQKGRIRNQCQIDTRPAEVETRDAFVH